MAGNISHGMNVDEVRQLGANLKSISGQINDMVNQLNAKVNNTSWVGPDAARFKNEWWPQHRQHLQKMGQDLAGFGQSALNNATEQENVSR
jgi:uncharacterized protein YukE